MHFDFRLGITRLALSREGAAGQDVAVSGISPLRIVVLVDGRLASTGEKREVAPGIRLEGLEDELSDLF